jgi:hypothetical protein
VPSISDKGYSTFIGPKASHFTSQNYSSETQSKIPALSVSSRCVSSFIQTSLELGPVLHTRTQRYRRPDAYSL